MSVGEPALSLGLAVFPSLQLARRTFNNPELEAGAAEQQRHSGNGPSDQQLHHPSITFRDPHQEKYAKTTMDYRKLVEY